MTIEASAPSIRLIPFVEDFDKARQEAIARSKDKFEIVSMLCVESPKGVTALPEKFLARNYEIATAYHAFRAVVDYLSTANKKALVLKPKGDVVDPYSMTIVSPAVALATKDPLVKTFFMKNRILPFIKVMSTELAEDERLLGLGFVGLHPTYQVGNEEVVAAFRNEATILGEKAKGLAA